MPVSEKEYFEALRSSDQRAVELLAKASSEKVSTRMVICSLMVAILSVGVAIISILLGVK